MRMPSIKTLTTNFPHLSSADARLIRSIGHATDSADDLSAIIDSKCPATAQYVRNLMSTPYYSQMWRVTVALHAMDVIMGTHGVEALGEGSLRAGPPHEYLNAGDAYAATLIYSRATDSVRVACWGDIAERMPDGAK